LLHQFAHLVHGSNNGLGTGGLFFDGGIDFLGNFGETASGLGNLRRADRLLVRGCANFLREFINFGDDVGDFMQRSAQIVAEAETFLDDTGAAFHVFHGLASFALDALD